MATSMSLNGHDSRHRPRKVSSSKAAMVRSLNRRGSLLLTELLIGQLVDARLSTSHKLRTANVTAECGLHFRSRPVSLLSIQYSVAHQPPPRLSLDQHRRIAHRRQLGTIARASYASLNASSCHIGLRSRSNHVRNLFLLRAHELASSKMATPGGLDQQSRVFLQQLPLHSLGILTHLVPHKPAAHMRLQALSSELLCIVLPSGRAATIRGLQLQRRGRLFSVVRLPPLSSFPAAMGRLNCRRCITLQRCYLALHLLHQCPSLQVAP